MIAGSMVGELMNALGDRKIGCKTAPVGPAIIAYLERAQRTICAGGLMPADRPAVTPRGR